VEQREADRPEATAEAQGDLGHPDLYNLKRILQIFETEMLVALMKA
jgi:hypothetical protein